MFAYVVKRALAGFLVILLMSLAIFALFWYGPSSPAQPICERDTSNRCSPEALERFERALGYDQPMLDQYGQFLKGVVAGREIAFSEQLVYQCDAPCLGYAYTTRAPVWEELKSRLPATASVAIGGGALYLLFGVPIGVAAARRRGTLADKALVSSFLILNSVPYYLFALLIFLYATVINEVPVISDTGYFPITENPARWFTGMLLAWVALGIFGATQYTRFTRGAMVETLGEDYIRTAKAKGLPTRTVVYKHGLRAALVPVVTIFGIDIGVLFAGTIFTERIFDINGIGLWALAAVGTRDLPIVQAAALFGAVIIITSNLLVDVVYSILDPRVRLS
ncbi:ABC transporter permease [Nocardioides perillae]|uniref:Peptide/nickel transport system permease protein n=1 Tax=Nocardioides perillae TaxID=1119534 RepID=A0A7Y9RWJ5_9ACTN|nr:ABC transporter permease [Nocardioides perillae]NYG56088.1 peptide/nickel transport system permease protein [Nocardioides perillae]